MQLGDAVHPVEQHAVVADHQQGAAEVVERVVQAEPGVDVEVVGRLVEQQHVGTPEQLGGQTDGDHLAAGERPERSVQRDVGQAEPGELGAGSLLDVPVVADRGEHGVGGVAGGQRVERVDDRRDAEHVGDGPVRIERQRLRQIAERAVDGHGARSRGVLARDEAQQRALARAVRCDQTGAATGDGEGQVVEQRRCRRAKRRTGVKKRWRRQTCERSLGEDRGDRATAWKDIETCSGAQERSDPGTGPALSGDVVSQHVFGPPRVRSTLVAPC